MKSKLILALLFSLSLSSCSVVKGYEKVEINDPDMALSSYKIDKQVMTVHAYREAASGGNSGKTGGGCGCN